MFSSRIPADLAPNRIARAAARLRAGRTDLIDLTESDPTRAGLTPSPDARLLLLDPEDRAHLSRPGRAVAPERGLTARTRAVLLVNPNNPTGSFVSAGELDAVAALCREHGLALIVDEVFGAYPLDGAASGPSVLDRPQEALTFSLGGLSKAVGLPQLKLAWVVAGGPRPAVDRALAGLELIADTYLSVAAPVQTAARALLEAGAETTARIAARVRANYAAIRRIAERHPAVRLLPADGGWSAVARVPATRPEETVVLNLLERGGVLIHPGYFFDFPHEAFLVVSLLPDPAAFRAGVERALAYASGDGDGER